MGERKSQRRQVREVMRARPGSPLQAVLEMLALIVNEMGDCWQVFIGGVI